MEIDKPLLPSADHPLRTKRLEDTAKQPCTILTCLCCGSRGKADISKDDRNALWTLRDDHCNMPVVRDSVETDRLLQDIWNSAFPDEPILRALPSQNWKRLGFQGTDPRTDVRSGVFPLQQLHYLAVTYPKRMETFCRQAKELDYFFAITCFNLSHMILVFFDLFNGHTVSSVAGAVPATRPQIINFARLCSRCRDGPVTVLNELFVALVELMHNTWKDMRASGNCNVMQHFYQAMSTVFDAHVDFWNEPRYELADLNDLYR